MAGGGFRATKSRKCKWLVKIGASYGVTPLNKKIMAGGGGGFRATRKPPWIRHWSVSMCTDFDAHI